MSKIISRTYPDAKIIGNKNTPRSGAFEVTLDNKQLYSKFQTGKFPTSLEIISWKQRI